MVTLFWFDSLIPFFWVWSFDDILLGLIGWLWCFFLFQTYRVFFSDCQLWAVCRSLSAWSNFRDNCSTALDASCFRTPMIQNPYKNLQMFILGLQQMFGRISVPTRSPQSPDKVSVTFQSDLWKVQRTTMRNEMFLEWAVVSEAAMQLLQKHQSGISRDFGPGFLPPSPITTTIKCHFSN